MDRHTDTGHDLFREHRVGHDRWLLSYADFMTLMFVFVTALYAMSAVDAAKLASGLRNFGS